MSVEEESPEVLQARLAAYKEQLAQVITFFKFPPAWSY